LPNHAAAGWSDVATDKQQINMRVPGMERWNPGYWKQVLDFDPGTGVANYSQWRNIEDYGIYAYLTYQKSRRGFKYYTLREQISHQVNKYSYSFIGNVKTHESTLGEFEYIHFSLVARTQKRKCIGFGQLSPGNKKLIYGQYCLSEHEEVDEDIVGPMIDSIDLEYESGRQTVENRSSASSSKTTDTSNKNTLSLANQGDADAQYTLGNNYHFGIGVKKDVVKARRWYLKAAENGHSEAQYDIGYNYEKGRFVSKSLNKAFNWYRKAAAQANARAQYKIGLFYEQGWSVSIDLDEALSWYKKAAAQGHALAGTSLDRLRSSTFVMEQTSESSGATVTLNIAERLRKIKQFLDEGLITEAEAAEKRKAILDEF
jgi:hypothetical protein